MSVVRTVPSKGVQFAAYDMSRKALARPNPDTGNMETSALGTTLAGSFAGITSTVTTHPLEMLQTRLACSPVGAAPGPAANHPLRLPPSRLRFRLRVTPVPPVASPRTCLLSPLRRPRLIPVRPPPSIAGMYTGVSDVVRQLLRKEGARGLFGGLGPSLVGVIPFTGLNFLIFDGIRWGYCKSTGVAPGVACPKNITLGAGCVAAVTAATATFPLEVVRRRMMMGARYKNTADGAALASSPPLPRPQIEIPSSRLFLPAAFAHADIEA